MPDQPSFLRSVLSGPNGLGSTARLCTLIVVLFAHLWVSYLVVIERGIPNLTGLTFWVTTLIGALYGTNKIAAVLSTKKVEPCDEPPQ